MDQANIGQREFWQDGLWQHLAPVAFLAAVAVYLGAELAATNRLGPPLDDGWIYMAFARSLAAGEGFTYPGHDGPVAAITGPIWCFLLAAAMGLAGPEVWVVKALGMLTGLGAVLATRRLAMSATGDPLLAGVAATVLAVTPQFVWGCMSGMEVPFFVFGTSLGLALHLERRCDSFWRWVPAVVALAAAGWARPECFVFPFLVAIARWRIDGVLAAIALTATFPAYHLAITGHPLPTTFYAKAGAEAPWAVLRHSGLGAAVELLVVNTTRQLAALTTTLVAHLPLVIPGLLLGVTRGWRARNGVPFLLGCVVVFTLARGALGFAPPWFQHGRYFTHLWPLFLIVCLHGLDLQRTSWRVGLLIGAAVLAGFAIDGPAALFLTTDWRAEGLRESMEKGIAVVIWPAVAALAIAAVALVVGFRRGTVGAPPAWAMLAWLVVALAFGEANHGRGVEDTYALNVAMAERVRELVPPGELVACHDIGALGFFADRPLLDLAGLGSPEVAFRQRVPGAPPDFAAILAEHRPRWACLTDQMVAAVNPAGQAPPGLIGAEIVYTIEHPENRTVLGASYYLVRLTWE